MVAALLLMLAAATATADPAPAVSPAGTGAAAEMPQAPVLVGGFEPLSTRAAELRPVVRLAVRSITPAGHAHARLVSAERQVVAGVNYRLRLKLRDGSQWQVVVWRRLDRTLQVTATVRLPEHA